MVPSDQFLLLRFPDSAANHLRNTPFLLLGNLGKPRVHLRCQPEFHRHGKLRRLACLASLRRLLRHGILHPTRRLHGPVLYVSVSHPVNPTRDVMGVASPRAPPGVDRYHPPGLVPATCVGRPMATETRGSMMHWRRSDAG